jgi:predicted RNase H-like nuclease (RuvC/YqgF family)
MPSLTTIITNLQAQIRNLNAVITKLNAQIQQLNNILKTRDAEILTLKAKIAELTKPHIIERFNLTSVAMFKSPINKSFKADEFNANENESD